MGKRQKKLAKNKENNNNPHHNIFRKDGEVSDEEFKKALQKVCLGKSFAQFPAGFKAFISNQYCSVDVDGKSHQYSTPQNYSIFES